MSFKNDYNALITAISVMDVNRAESIISQSDEKSKYIANSIEHFGEYRICYISERFKSAGIKRLVDSIINE